MFQTAQMTFKVIQGHWQRCHSVGHTTYDFLLVSQCNCAFILHR